MTQIPEWLGAAVIGAVLASLGYVGKLVIESWLRIRDAQVARRARLVELQSLLRAAWVSFAVQNAHAQHLLSMVRDNHPGLATGGEGYERVFSSVYATFTPKERELHDLIRSITISSLRPTNESLSAWLKSDTYFKAQRPSKTALGELAKELAVLEAHLILWHAKYATWIPNTPEHALVYLSDEEGHGIGFPSGIDDAVRRALA